MSRTDERLDFTRRLEKYGADVEVRFEKLRSSNRVEGKFDDCSWKFAGRNLHFSSARSRVVPIRGPLCVVARGFVVESIDLGLRQEAVYGRLHAVRHLFDQIGPDAARFEALTKVEFNAVLAALVRQSRGSTAYNRANALASFSAYVDAIRVGSGPTASSLLGRRVAWRSKMKNPIRRSIEVDTAGESDQGNKYLPSLHLALGRARSAVRADPTLEPSPGFDLIRLESLAFMMATGLRVGELCALSTECLGTDDASGSLFVRVPTEKEAAPSARPVAEVWAESVNEAYDYLIERCREPRLRARDIEHRGFDFIGEKLRLYRKEEGVDEAFASQVAALGLDVDRHYKIEEVTKVFGLSTKEFADSGRFAGSTTPLPRIVASRFVLWGDQRMRLWDWSSFAIDRIDLRTEQAGNRYLSASAIAERIGGGRSCLMKASWIFKDLRKFLMLLSEHGAFEAADLGGEARSAISEAWDVLRSSALARTGGAMCTAVDVVALQEICVQRYSSYLTQHFKENCSADEDGAPIVPGARAGVSEKLSQHLIVLWDNSFSGTTSRGLIPRPIFRSDFYNYLSKNAQKKTVFERLAISGEEGRTFSVTPHQLRHWVTTAVFRSGPSETMVDLWMGRSVGQSRVYDHRTARERAEAIRERYLLQDPPEDHLGRQVRFWRATGLDPAAIKEHLESKLRVMHFVPTGACSRELFLSPCTRGLMCLKGFGTDSACPSFHIDTQDHQAKAQIVSLREKYAAMLRVLYPTAGDLVDVMKEELNLSETLDQHILHIRDVLRGCDQALDAYERACTSSPPERLISLRVLT